MLVVGAELVAFSRVAVGSADAFVLEAREIAFVVVSFVASVPFADGVVTQARQGELEDLGVAGQNRPWASEGDCSASTQGDWA